MPRVRDRRAGVTILSAVKSLLADGPKSLQALYADLPDELEHSIRARIYENLGKHFRRIEKGVYVAVHGEAACVLIEGDAWEEVRKLPSDSIDAVIADPPYPWLDKLIAQGTTRKKSGALTFQTREVDVALGCEIYRVMKKGAHAFFFVPSESATTRKHVERFIQILELCGFKFNKRFVWDRVRLGMGYNGRCRYEGILFMSKGPRRIPCDLSIADLLPFKAPDPRVRIHETEKPISLLEKLILFATKAGETVLDCFAGSCSTGVAALKLGRNAILIERGYA